MEIFAKVTYSGHFDIKSGWLMEGIPVFKERVACEDWYSGRFWELKDGILHRKGFRLFVIDEMSFEPQTFERNLVRQY